MDKKEELTEKPQIDELEKQLHEQYAINNNSNLGSIITLAGTLLVVVGYFGYVFVNSSSEFSKGFLYLRNDNGVYYIDALLCSYIVSLFILFFLSRFCIYQGIAQRKEQFITHAIRKKHGIINNDGGIVFPKKYNPFYKKGLEVVQGLYGELVKVFNIVFILISIAVLLKVITNLIMFKSLDILGIMEVAICLLVVFVFIIVSKCYYHEQLLSYIRRQCEYDVEGVLDEVKSLLETKQSKCKIISKYNEIASVQSDQIMFKKKGI